MTEDTDNNFEQASLMKGRYYLILEPLQDEHQKTDSFAVRAYSTTDNIITENGEEVYDPTYVILQGLLGCIHEDFDNVFEMGLERVTLEAIAEEFTEEEMDPSALKRIREIEGNVVSVDFGKVQ